MFSISMTFLLGLQLVRNVYTVLGRKGLIATYTNELVVSRFDNMKTNLVITVRDIGIEVVIQLGQVPFVELDNSSVSKFILFL